MPRSMATCAAAINVLKDVYKTEVFRLARWRNQDTPADALGPDGAVIPETHHRKAAHRRTQSRPDRPGFAAAL